MDGAFSFIVFVIIVFLRSRAPPYLDAKADPTKFFVPYPAWYFLSLFGLLGLVPPEIHVGPLTISLELIATIIVPTLFLLVVLLLPWLDRSRSRSFASRAGLLWATTIVMIGIVGLTIFGQVTTMIKQAAAPPSPPESVVLSQAEAATVPAGSAGSTTASASGAGAQGATSAAGAKVFSTNCASCHGAQGTGVPGTFPPLADNPVVTGDREEGYRHRSRRSARLDQRQRSDVQRHDAGLERYALQQRRRRRSHLHSRIARKQ